ncbi:MAG: hypothetical protein RR413_12340, partial [Christensenellaceae bacterium]
MKKIISQLALRGYDLLGENGQDGVRYAWKFLNHSSLVESAAFAQRSKICMDRVCGYTTSVSAGCILRQFKQNCKFCRTGSLLPFAGLLSAFDIAKQNVFMVLSDIKKNNRCQRLFKVNIIV